MGGQGPGGWGRQRHRAPLANSNGSRHLFSARKGDNHVLSWYGQGFPYLEKRYLDRACVQIRLNDGSDCFFARPGEEELLLTSRKESWTRRAGKEARYQQIGPPLIVFDHGESAQEE